MRDTTLNLIALSVFSFTMMSLLGPLMSLPAVVPAVTAAGLLGLATLDQLSLQGRLGNILVDGFAWTSSEHRQRVLCHEAGHFLVASLLGIPVVAYSLNTWEAWRRGLPGQGGVVFDTQVLAADLDQGQISRDLLERYYRVWMAGIAAEQTVYGEALGGSDDRQKFVQLWQQMGRPAAEGAVQQRWAILQAKSLIATHQATFEALVAAMGRRESVEACRALIQASSAPPDCAPQP